MTDHLDRLAEKVLEGQTQGRQRPSVGWRFPKQLDEFIVMSVYLDSSKVDALRQAANAEGLETNEYVRRSVLIDAVALRERWDMERFDDGINALADARFGDNSRWMTRSSSELSL